MMTVTDVPAAAPMTRRAWRPGAIMLAVVDIVLGFVAQRFGTMRWTLERTPPALCPVGCAGVAHRS
jgi:hypothetical protein